MEITVEPAQDPGPQDVSVQTLSISTGVKGSQAAPKLRCKGINQILHNNYTAICFTFLQFSHLEVQVTIRPTCEDVGVQCDMLTFRDAEVQCELSDDVASLSMPAAVQEPYCSNSESECADAAQSAESSTDAYISSS